MKISEINIIFIGLLFLIYNGATAENIALATPKYRSSLRQKDNQKPVFDDCAKYSPSIKEGENVNTFVIKVHATDRDLPNEGGTVTYSFEKSSHESSSSFSEEPSGSTELNGFYINPVTGEITTNATFDRDPPAFQKKVYLTVVATDNGYPPLYDICMFKVTIEDINDNAPIFDKSSYNRSVPIDFQIGNEVLRTFAYDIDELNSIVTYKLTPKKREDDGYFKIDENTGIVYLKKAIDKQLKYVFDMKVTAQDQGPQPKSSTVDLGIQVIESSKKMPSFLPIAKNVIEVYENLTVYGESLIHLEAQSNIPDAPDVEFNLIYSSGKKGARSPFRLLDKGNNAADLFLQEPLDYEKTTEYKLTVQIENKYNLVAEKEITIKVLDVNDNIPIFQMPFKGRVFENEPPGTIVMTAHALDADATSTHNQITYELSKKDQENFAIDPHNGTIWTRKSFDREKQSKYNILVIAKDNSPSALTNNGQPNKDEVMFTIYIDDKNDNAPRFKQSLYEVFNVSEAENINTRITQVEAEDPDIGDRVHYNIVSGNINDTFRIGETTGYIFINKELDYEKVTEYNLTVRAFDGVWEERATVMIYIANVNDNPPQFETQTKKIEIEEETFYEGCLTRVIAYDPDIRDRNADQKIIYSIAQAQDKEFFSIDNSGCLKMKQQLDRDPPNGYSTWTVRIIAQDELGQATSQQNTEIIYIYLIDINDNPPFLHMDGPVIWNERNKPGPITELKADDNDSDKNGPPFTFRIDTASPLYKAISNKFEIVEKKILKALVEFDREEQKSYEIPLLITDSGSPPLTGSDVLTVIIGDRNDNPMKEGSSTIFVYTERGMIHEMQIGRVYVEDPDDWDLPDKTFRLKTNVDGSFKVDQRTGMITLLRTSKSGFYSMEFEVTEKSEYFPTHSVNAFVNVTVKDIPREAIIKSGSIRFSGISAEEFVSSQKKIMLHNRLASIFKAPKDNVDLFTILHSPHHNGSDLLDVRFTVHDVGRPYYEEDKLNTLVAQSVKGIQSELDTNIVLVKIDECIDEKVCNMTSCRNLLNISQKPYSIFTNTSSFVGINAVVDSECNCNVEETIVCLNGGTRLDKECLCPENMHGPRCELLSIGFRGDGYAVVPNPGETCDNSELHVQVKPTAKDGLVFYMGPLFYSNYMQVQDFMSLELKDGFPTFYINFGSGTSVLQNEQVNLNDEKAHTIDIFWSTDMIEMQIDGCGESCKTRAIPIGKNKLLNVNSPIQVGGSITRFADVASQFNWDHTPTDKGFAGCISNMTINHKTINLGIPVLSSNDIPGCDKTEAASIVHVGINSYFYAALLACILLLLVLVAVLLVYKHKTYNTHVRKLEELDDPSTKMMSPDVECGELDNDLIDMKVLQIPSKDVFESPVVIPFQGNTDNGPYDPEPLYPEDDVRRYAYEGDGDSIGSLSSIASGTDDEDLEFNHLLQAGPGFKNLAHIYGSDDSDEEV